MAKKKLPRNRKIQYYTQHRLIDLQNKYFARFDYNFWMHKANALTHLITNPESVHILKFEGDNADDEVIVESLKMELHMTAMHCIESFFRIFHSALYNPTIPWIGMAQCTADDLFSFIRSIKMSGISSLVSNVKQWLQSSIYPTIDENHPMFERSKNSIDFIICYFDRLANEFIEHKEYNSYKHGLHCFPGSQTIQAIGEQTGKKYIESSNDIIEFLEFGKTERNGRKRVSITTKAYSNIKDYNIIMTNSAILHNLHMFKGIAAANRMSGIAENSFIHHGYYHFDDRKVIDIFLDGDTSGPVKRFTF